MDVVISIAGKIGELLIEPIGRQFGYFIRYSSNIETLQKQVQILEGVRKDVQASIDAAERNCEVIRNEVQNWTSEVDEILLEAKKLHDEASKARFHNLASRYQLSRKAQKITIAIKDLKNDSKFDRVSNPAPPPMIEFPSQDVVIFESTELVIEEIMGALKDNKTNFIGIHGMGGVGKTTLVKEVIKRAQEGRLFATIAMVVVSQTVDVKKIQDQIAERLGLKLKEISNEQDRVSLLHARLKNENKVLIILDDLWARLDLATVGIPFGHDYASCKIMVTTRRRQVCDAMVDKRSVTAKIIPINILSEKESWVLLKKNVGDDIESPTLNSLAKEIIRECGGLPITLVTVGRAMRGKDPDEWRVAVEKLKKSQPQFIEGMHKDVYRCLQLSYDYLQNEEAKKVLKLCSLFPEDFNIPVEDLVRYGVGLKIFEDVVRMEDARRNAISIIKNLKASCLLLESDKEGCVKMHDVVRDVALSMASDYFVRDGFKQLECWPSAEDMKIFTGISITQNEISQFPDAWDCPNLKILLMRDIYDHIEPSSMPNAVLLGMKALEVFHLGGLRRGSSFNGHLKQEFGQLTNLRTLILQDYLIGDATAIGELKMLEILDFKRCQFREPFSTITKLTKLKLLDVEYCSHSRRISSIFPTNAISSSSQLEELYKLAFDFSSAFSAMYMSARLLFDDFDITELKSLSRLTTLTITIRTIPEGFIFPNLKFFKIHLARWIPYGAIGYMKGMILSHESNYLVLSDATISSLGCFKPLLPRTNYLYLVYFEDLRNIIPCLLFSNGDGLAGLRSMKIDSCANFEYLINVEEWQIRYAYLLELEELYLEQLKTFKALCNTELPPEISLSMSKLKRLYFSSCGELSNVFAPFNPQQQFKQLEALEVYHCNALECIFEKKGTPLSIRELHLKSLEGMKHIWESPSELLHLHNLQIVKIESCKKLRVIFPASIAQGLERLKELDLCDCDELEAIVAERREGEETIDNVVFYQLIKLSLRTLLNLKAFCMDNLPFKWPSLEMVEVSNCPKMKTFAASDGNQSTPKLKVVKVNNSDILLDGTDFNTVIQNHYKEEGVAGPSN
ncbi:disease resistance protein At4g27190 [Hevea brasiliensis]|uniref:disease resistance protein At4g27190 n=1 Tax=Hevea brasiliensis TaxID=3981 RepID=UPI0025CE3BAD|nr:disease resistance protein At4g27190 [Hevea brasiliensis]